MICNIGRSDLPDMHTQAQGRAAPRVSVDISGKLRLRMLHMLCNTSGILRIALHYIGKDGTFDYRI